MDRPKVAREASSAVQRRRFFFSEGRKSNTSTPTRGKRVTRFKGLVKKFIVCPFPSPLYPSPIGKGDGGEGRSLFHQQIP
jgi:hypothetical protein